MFLLFIILATSFMPLYADNDIKAINNTNEAKFSEDMSFMAPRKRPKSKKRGVRRGNKGQEQEQFRIGIELGGNMSSFLTSKEYKDAISALPGTAYTTASGIGFQAGVYFDYNINEMFFVEAGLYGIQRPSEEAVVIANPLGGMTTKTAYSPLYVQVPILFGVNFSITDDFSINAKVGTYVGFGVAGETKAEASMIVPGVSPLITEGKEDFFDDTTEKLDYGLRAGLGVEFSKITLGFFMDYGLANIFKDAPDNFSMKNFSLGVNVGYRF